MWFKEDATRILYHLGRLATAAAQLVGLIMVCLGAVHGEDVNYMGELEPGLEILIGLVLLAGGVFLESRLSEYDEKWHYVLCILFTPIRAITQLVTLVRVVIATVQGDHEFAERGCTGTEFIEHVVYVLFGWEHEGFKTSRRSHWQAREAAMKAAAPKTTPAERAAAEAARKASLPDDRSGAIFLKTSMCDKPASGYNYGERNVYRNGEAVVYVHFTLDWQYREGRSLDESWEQAEYAARVFCEKAVTRYYKNYCARVRNPVSEPRLSLTIKRGTMRK